MPLVKEHGTAVIALTIDEQGQARTAEDKLRIASRLVDDLVGVGHAGRGHHRRLPDLPDRDRSGGDPPRRHRDDRGDPALVAKYPGINTTLGVSNVSFGLNPAARSVLNSVFLHEATQAGLTSGIIDARRSCRWPPRRAAQVALDLVWDRREWDADGTLTYDPLATMLDLFAGVDTAALRDQRAAELAGAAGRRAAGAPHHRRRAKGSRPTSTWRARGADARSRRCRSSTTTCWRA
jgi:5-methyltetrahydrofolate--homocysteine methyltransferase